MFNQVIEYVKEHDMIRQKDRIVVGVSGGADSVCLLFVLKELQLLYDLDLFVVHINHGLRGDEAKRDEEYVISLCDELGVSCHAVNVDVNAYAKKHKCSSEEAGRILRYEAFEQEYNEHSCNKIAVAHNKNDIAETVLLNLSRGTGIKGLIGIEPVRGKIVRPLLCVTRDEIEEYLCNKEIAYCTDSTNLQDIYSRNKIRHHVLPELMRINEQAVSHIARCSANLSEIEQYLTKQTSMLFESTVTVKNGQYFVNVNELRKADLVLAKRLIRQVIHECAGKLKDIDEKHVQVVYALLDKEVSKQVNLPYRLVAYRGYHEIVIMKAKPKEEAEQKEWKVEIDGPGTYRLEEAHYELHAEIIEYQKNMIIPQNGYTKWFDYDRIKNTIFVRYRAQGDYLVINEKGSKKTIKSLFIDEKIPREKRGKIPLLCDGDHVMWVITGRISEAYKVTQQSKKILVVTIMEV